MASNTNVWDQQQDSVILERYLKIFVSLKRFEFLILLIFWCAHKHCTVTRKKKILNTVTCITLLIIIIVQAVWKTESESNNLHRSNMLTCITEMVCNAIWFSANQTQATNVMGKPLVDINLYIFL